jgi:predicted alpha/beta superfamily hydrolase
MHRFFTQLVLCFFTLISINAQESTTSKNVSTFTIESPQLQTTKKIWVYLPENYTASDKKYTVVYMHDAQNLFDKKTSYSGEWNIDEKLDSLKAPVIIIGIEHGNEKRIDELAPYKNKKHGGGNAQNYIDFIVKTLKPYVDQNYRTKPKAKNTIIMGSSLGGLVSFYAILKYPEIFGKAGVFSPSFQFTNDIYTLVKQTPKIKAKIYFMCGDKESDDMVPDLHQMEGLLDTKRCYYKTTIIKGGEHNEKLWRNEFVKAILWLGY